MFVRKRRKHEIDKMTEAGRILAITHDEMRKALKPGMSTKEIDVLGEQVIRSFGCEPSFLNYCGYPASICISINNEVVHGIPRADRIIQKGDLISLDAGVIYQGYHSDSARSYIVGYTEQEARESTDSKVVEAQRLIDVTKQSFFEGIRFAKAGNYLNDISKAIQIYAENNGCAVIRDLAGHGIGKKLHEKPTIFNYDIGKKGIRLKPGMTLAIEPMLATSDYEVEWLDDDWTVVTSDGSLAAHYENTIVITEGDPVILSKAENVMI